MIYGKVSKTTCQCGRPANTVTTLQDKPMCLRCAATLYRRQALARPRAAVR